MNKIYVSLYDLPRPINGASYKWILQFATSEKPGWAAERTYFGGTEKSTIARFKRNVGITKRCQIVRMYN